jgi:hypothetical protein
MSAKSIFFSVSSELRSTFFILGLKTCLLLLKVDQWFKLFSTPQIGILTGLGRKSAPMMNIENQLEIFYEQRPFRKALICQIRIAETRVMCEKAYFYGRGSWSRSDYRTPRP